MLQGLLKGSEVHKIQVLSLEAGTSEKFCLQQVWIPS